MSQSMYPWERKTYSIKLFKFHKINCSVSITFQTFNKLMNKKLISQKWYIYILKHIFPRLSSQLTEFSQKDFLFPVFNELYQWLQPRKSTPFYHNSKTGVGSQIIVGNALGKLCGIVWAPQTLMLAWLKSSSLHRQH
jgi:hypothetical protein